MSCLIRHESASVLQRRPRIAELGASIVEAGKPQDEQERHSENPRGFTHGKVWLAASDLRQFATGPVALPLELTCTTHGGGCMKHTRTWLLLGAGALLVANAEIGAQGSGIPISKDRPSPSATPGAKTVAVVGGEVTLSTPFSLAAYTGLNEKNITALFAAGDSAEIQFGQLAQSKGTSMQVRDFGTMLLNDHTAHLAKTHEIITDEKVGFEAPMNDPEGARLREMLMKLRSMPAGTAWDAAFLRFQAGHHQNVIDILNANIKNAHDDDLEDHIKKSLTSLAKHRDTAKSIATTLGVMMP
jgi:putative membrane protein